MKPATDLQPSVENDQEISSAFRGVLAVFRRRIWTFLSVAIVVFAVIAVGAMMLKPQYEAKTRIKIEPNRSAVTGMDAERASAADVAVIDTEVSVIQSRDLAREVVRSLKLQYDPVLTEGMPRLQPQSAATETRIDAVAGRVLSGLKAEREDNTYVVDLSFRSGDPEVAARVANGIAASYINNSVGVRTGSASQQARQLEQRLAALGAEVRAAEARIAQYRANLGITLGTNSATITDQQVSPISNQLAEAEAEASAARSNLSAARKQIASGQLETVSGVLNSGVVADLRRQRAEVLRNRGEVATRYGPRHPETQRVQQQLESIDTQIQQEAQRVTNALTAQAAAADAKAESLRSALNRVKGEQASNTRASVTVESLERDVEAKRLAYNRLAEATQQANQVSRNSTPQAMVVEQAVVPNNPAFPNTRLLLAAGFILALIVATAAVALLEMLSSGFRTAADVESTLGLPLIAAVPRLRGQDRKGLPKNTRPPDLLVARETSFYAEAIRNLRTTLLLSPGTQPPQVISVVSTLPGEGKTTTSLSLARVLAMGGERTILIDGDLRRAGLREYAPNSGASGLVEVLSEGAPLSEAIQNDVVPNLDILFVRRPLFSSSDLLGTPAMRELLGQLRGSYDRVVIDTPPLLGMADARTLASLSDAVVLVVKWTSTSTDAVQSAVSTLSLDGVRPAGVALSMVDPASETAGASYYARRYSQYYAK